MGDKTQSMTPEQLLFWLKGILDAETNNRRVPTHLIREAVDATFKNFTTASITHYPYQGGAISTGTTYTTPPNAWAGETTLAKCPTL